MKAKGRMIRKDISLSDGFAKLTPKAAVLFTCIIPHLDAHGKLNGEPEFVKGLCVPKVSYLTVRAIRACLEEINRETNLKWFEVGRIHYIQSLSWDEHQDLRDDRMGADELPSYPGILQESSGVLPLEVEVEGEVKGEGKKEECGEAAILSFPVHKGIEGKTEWALTPSKLREYQDSFPSLDVLSICRQARQWCLDNRDRRKTFRGMPKFLGRWLTREVNRPKGGSYGRYERTEKVIGSHGPEAGKYSGLRDRDVSDLQKPG